MPRHCLRIHQHLTSRIIYTNISHQPLSKLFISYIFFSVKYIMQYLHYLGLLHNNKELSTYILLGFWILVLAFFLLLHFGYPLLHWIHYQLGSSLDAVSTSTRMMVLHRTGSVSKGGSVPY